MPLWKRKALNLTKEEILYVMANTKSNRQAAKFIGCNISTWKTYATRYFDEETGLTLYEKHKNQAGIGIHRRTNHKLYQKKDIFEILDGKHPTYKPGKLAARLIEECIIPEKCNNCGFEERRITDYKMPLILVHLDGDLTNHKLENLEFLCYNCYFLTYDELYHKLTRVQFKGY